MRTEYPDIGGLSDYVSYWFRKTHDLLPEGGRAGLVATANIRSATRRAITLDYMSTTAAPSPRPLRTSPVRRRHGRGLHRQLGQGYESRSEDPLAHPRDDEDGGREITGSLSPEHRPCASEQAGGQSPPAGLLSGPDPSTHARLP